MEIAEVRKMVSNTYSLECNYRRDFTCIPIKLVTFQFLGGERNNCTQQIVLYDDYDLRVETYHYGYTID